MSKISIVIPVYNEFQTIDELHQRLSKAMKQDFHGWNHQIIFVDDGSTDETLRTIHSIQKSDATIQVVSFSRNFGHHAAITAGLERADGDVVVIMDGDLQDRPEEIAKLHARLQEGYDIVYAVRKRRRDPLFKRMASGIFWRLFRTVSGLNVVENQSMLRIFTKTFHTALNQMQESNRFYAGLCAWVGFRQTHCFVDHDERHHGKTKYSFAKMVALMIDATLSFSNKPLYYISYLGIGIALLSLLFGISIFIRKAAFQEAIAMGWPSVMVLVSFLGGITIFSLGTIGLYMGRLYQRSLHRPLYIIKEEHP